MKQNPHLKKSINVVQNVLLKNAEQGAKIRADFERMGICALNFMSAPGSGKTSILEALALRKEFKFAVIEGDLETENDAQKLRARGVAAEQIQTGSACHLDAFMIEGALARLQAAGALSGCELCVVENIGNLVCPASYDVGAHFNVVLLSVAEGDDKPDKYPVMFRRADLVLISKADLAEHFDFSPAAVRASMAALNPAALVLEISSKSGAGMDELARWIRQKIAEVAAAGAAGESEQQAEESEQQAAGGASGESEQQAAESERG